MSKALTKKDLTDALFTFKKGFKEELLIATKKDLVGALSTFKGELKSELKDELKIFATKEELKGAIEGVMKGIHQIQDTLDDMQPQVDLVEKHDRRIEELEKRNRVVKQIFEKDLKVKVAW